MRRLAIVASSLALSLPGCSLDRSGEAGAGGTGDGSTSAAGSTSDASGGPTTSASSVTSGDAIVSAGTGGETGAGGDPGTGGAPGTGGDLGVGGTDPSSGSSSASDASASSSSGGEPPVCGDLDVAPPEECDDGGTTPGDRCGATCLDEHPDTCPGTPIALAAGELTIQDSTVGADDTFQDTQNAGDCVGSWSGSDLIYAVTPASSGTLVAQVDADFAQHVTLIRTACPSLGADVVDCDYSYDEATRDSVEAVVQGGATYYVVVDSFGNTSGTFTLLLTLE